VKKVKAELLVTQWNIQNQNEYALDETGLKTLKGPDRLIFINTYDKNVLDAGGMDHRKLLGSHALPKHNLLLPLLEIEYHARGILGLTS